MLDYPATSSHLLLVPLLLPLSYNWNSQIAAEMWRAKFKTGEIWDKQVPPSLPTWEIRRMRHSEAAVLGGDTTFAVTFRSSLWILLTSAKDGWTHCADGWEPLHSSRAPSAVLVKMHYVLRKNEEPWFTSSLSGNTTTFCYFSPHCLPTEKRKEKTPCQA